jgi:Putative Actinobacterial Holin-X, holin superfamily III
MDQPMSEQATLSGQRSDGLERQSTPELLRSIATDTSTLLRKEIELGKAEMVEALMARVKGAALMVAAGMLGLLVVIFLALAGAVALDSVMPGWASRLTVAGGLLVLAGLAALVGLRRMKKPSFAPEQTKRTVKEDVAWARNQLKR